ncbi:MAG TPA: acido-empty-quinoprotein group A [Bryobacteraceae bacterium]|nr:acido-empty-quinoprotein group A [Bryobacteraceae bacterium]
MKRALLLFTCCAVFAADGGLDPARILHPTPDSWPIYHGDYSGRRYSTLAKINDKNVKSMTLAWVWRSGRVDGGLKGTPILTGGVLYYSAPDHAWAIDARTGRELWKFDWQSKGGIHIGNRGPAVDGNWMYFLTPDCNIVSLNIRDGSERWHKQNCDLDQFYYGSVAPVIIRNHVIAGVSGDDLDRPGYLSSYDPETGALQWRWYAVPQHKGEPGSDTWPNEDAMKHGGGMTWQVPTYDPDLNLLYVTTGNPQPVIAHANRAGDNLFTASVVALNPDTGKLAWYFQASPHDTHDWDATQVPVLIDGEFNGQPRKMLALAARNGYFFLLDRATGKNLVTSQYVPTNWAKGIAKNGEPIPDPAKMPQVAGAIVSPNQGGATNWPPPTFSPKTGLFYVSAVRAYSVYYIYDTDDNPQGWGGTDRGGANLGSSVEAIDYKTGKVRWSHQWESGGHSGLMSTAGNLVFAGDGAGNFVALNATTGEPLWHANLGASISNGPITYELDGTQYVVVTAGDTMWAFAML